METPPVRVEEEGEVRDRRDGLGKEGEVARMLGRML